MFASEKVMMNYLDQLLTDDPEAQLPNSESLSAESEYSAKIRQEFSELEQHPKDNNLGLRPIEKVIVADKTLPVIEQVPEIPEVNSLEHLLLQVSLQQQATEKKVSQAQSVKTETKLKAESKVATEPKIETELKTAILTKSAVNVEKPSKVSETAPEVEFRQDKIEEPFQALFFEVAGLVLAVPLKELGGIHNLTDVSSLFGKPDWFLGVMVNRDKKINVVESAKWVMPEKYTKELQSELNYKYLIMLGESAWGFAAEKLITTEYVRPEDVKWRTKAGKRPWLLGTIKEKMCALLHVDDLIAMLEKGINARQE